MAGAGEGGEEEKQLAGGIQECPRNLLQQFSGGAICLEEAPAAASGGTEEDSGEIELSLGLSLGGCFGVNPASKRGLQRSSSIAAIPFLQPREEDPTVSPPLKRTASLPAEAEEEQRKRKELHCLRRMEAKRRKSEKANVSLPWARDPTASPEQDGDGEPGWLRRPENNQLGGWWAPNRVAAAVSRGGEAAAVEWTRGLAAASQGSVGSQGSSSSGVSDIGCRPQKKEELPSNGTGRWGSTSITQQLTDLTEHRALTVGKPAKNGTAGREEEVEAPWKEPKAAVGMSRRNRGVNGAMEDMPCVSTRGGGPDGKLVEGFLYKYGKGEEVRIVCVCHGRFLSPAEFVRHAGGGDVAHPLRHIIVNPSPPFFL